MGNWKAWVFAPIIILSYLMRACGHVYLESVDDVWKQNFKGIEVKNRVKFITDYCKGKRVVHFGFVDHPFTEGKIQSGELLHLKIKEISQSLLGVDNDERACRTYTQVTGDSNVIICDMNDISEISDKIREFDIYLLGEILEHLPDPVTAIKLVGKVMNKNSVLLVSVPNAYSLSTFISALNSIDLIHPDHVGQYSIYTLKKLFVSQGFETIEIGTYSNSEKRSRLMLNRFPLVSDGIVGAFRLRNN